MKSERWRDIEDLYHAALERQPEQRASFLEQACAGDIALRHEVESLLAQQSNGDRLLETPALQQAAPLLTDASSEMLTRLAAGVRLGPYRVVSLLGAGGMGEVYRARDTRLGREVALKLLPRDRLSDPERRRRFLQEARTASALNHPNIVTFFDLGSADGQDFLVLEYIAGQTLGRLISRRGLPIREALSYAIQIADALAAAHDTGIVHRDLKPGNVMVSARGTVKLLDFGLAKLMEPVPAGAEASETPHTSSGVILGTLSYMSPEQAQGRLTDARSDIFSFGAVLYEMITGQRAFPGDSPVAALSAILRDEPRAPISLRHDMPHDLEQITLRCLRKDPERRFQHADDIKIALLEIQQEINAAKPVSRVRRSLRAALVLIATLTLAAIAWLLYHRASSFEGPLIARPLTSYPGHELDPAFSPDGNQVAFVWEGKNRNNGDIYVKLIGPGEPLRLTSDPAWDYSPSWSPDGRWIAFLRELPGLRSAVLLVPALGGAERKLAEIETPEQGWPGDESRVVTWTPDGKWLVIPSQPALSEQRGLFLLSVDTGAQRRLTSSPPTWWMDRSPAFSPNGRMLAFSRTLSFQASDIYLLRLSPDLSSEGESGPLTRDNRWNDSPIWITDRDIVFSSNRDGTQALWRMPASGGQLPRRLQLPGQDVVLPAFSRQSHRLAYVDKFRNSSIWRVALSDAAGASTPPTQLISSSRRDDNPDFSLDGRRIAFQSDRSGNLEIWVCDSDGSHARQLTYFGRGHTGTPRWSPDGKRIAFDSNVEGQYQVYMVEAEGGTPRRVTDPPYFNAIPAWSGDGVWIYFTSQRSGRNEIWKMPSKGGQATRITMNGGMAAAESHDGRTLYYLNRPHYDANAPELWQVPVEGGPEKKVLGAVVQRNFFPTEQGIYYEALVPPDAWSIRLFRPAAGTDTRIDAIKKTPDFRLIISPDRRSLLYGQVDEQGSDLMLVENFR